MIIEQSNIFAKKVKKLHPNQKAVLDQAIQKIAENPSEGERKKGVLQDVLVYKFPMLSHLMLLAYLHPTEEKIILLSFGSHENFYRTLEGHPDL